MRHKHRPLTHKHKSARLECARSYHNKSAHEWGLVAWNDEKWFNIDGKDGNRYY